MIFRSRWRRSKAYDTVIGEKICIKRNRESNQDPEEFKISRYSRGILRNWTSLLLARHPGFGAEEFSMGELEMAIKHKYLEKKGAWQRRHLWMVRYQLPTTRFNLYVGCKDAKENFKIDSTSPTEHMHLLSGPQANILLMSMSSVGNERTVSTNSAAQEASNLIPAAAYKKNVFCRFLLSPSFTP